jgi:DNA-binding LacI/PurR family transcriptional regulator
VAAPRLAGLIFTTNPRFLASDPILTRAGIPKVVITNTPIPGTITMDFDYASLIDSAMDLLAAHGRRRVAVLNLSAVESPEVRMIQASAQQRGMACPMHWVQAVDHLHPRWANPLVQLLMRAPAGERPDALLITDDNLVEPATAALLAAGIQVPRDLSVVAHCNFPDPSNSHVPAERLGFDVRQTLLRAVELIDLHHAGQPVPPVSILKATFAPSSFANAGLAGWPHRA